MSRTNKIILALAIIAVVIGGIMFYTATRDQQDLAGDEQNNTNTSDTTQTPSNGIASIKEIMTEGGTLRCEYTDDQNQKFVAYVKGTEVRTTIQNPKSTTNPSNFILKGTTLYMWPSGSSTQGLKVTVDEETIKKAQQQTQGADDVDKATNTDIIGALESYKNNCVRASVDDSQFVIPTNIKFQDFSQLYNR